MRMNNAPFTVHYNRKLYGYLFDAHARVAFLFKRFPVITMVVFGKESVNVTWLERINIGDVQANELRRNVIVNRVDEFYTRHEFIAHLNQVYHGTGTN